MMRAKNLVEISEMIRQGRIFLGQTNGERGDDLVKKKVSNVARGRKG
jgi:hypothetical protein